MTTRSRFRHLPLLTILALVALGLGITPAVVHASTITVTTTADEYGTGGRCSLREAIHAAKHDTAFGGCAAGSGTDTISVPDGTYLLTLAGQDENAGATGDLDITGALTLSGASARTTIIDANRLDRVFDIFSTATVSISGVTIQNGQPGPDALMGEAGGISNAGKLTLTNSIVHGNSASAAGGIMNGGTLTVTNSTVSKNTADAGGGIYNSGTLTVTNSTISGNIVQMSVGGGILTLGGTVTLSNSTITANSADAGGGILGTVIARNTIIAGNRGADLGDDDCSGHLVSQGYNLIDNLTRCTISGDTTGNITGQDPRLGRLEDNGGPTWTHALLAGSPAIDAGRPGPAGSGDGACEATDQRGVTRPADGDGNVSRRCDIGAFEHEPAVTATATATSTQTLTATPTGTSRPPATPTRTATTQPTAGPALQRVYLPLVVNHRRAGP